MLYSNTNSGRLFRFGYERVYFFLPSVLGDTRKEKQIIKAYANHTMLTPHTHTRACARARHIL